MSNAWLRDILPSGELRGSVQLWKEMTLERPRGRCCKHMEDASNLFSTFYGLDVEKSMENVNINYNGSSK